MQQKWQAQIARYHKNPHSTWQFILRVLTTYMRPFIGLLLLSVLTNALVAVSTGALPWLIQQSIDHVFQKQNAILLYAIPLAVIAVSILRAVSIYASHILFNYVSQKSNANLQRDLFTVLVQSDIAFIAQDHSAEYTTLFTSDSARFKTVASNAIVGLGRHILTIIALISMMFVMNWQLATIFAGIVLPAGYILTNRLGRTTHTASHAGLQEIGSLSSLVSETLTGLRTVKAYGQEAHQLERAHNVIDNIVRYGNRALRAQSTASPIIEALAGIGVAAVLFFGAQQSIAGDLTAGKFIGFVSALMLTYQPMRAFATLQTQIQEGIAAGHRLFAVLDTDAKIIDTPDASDLEVHKGALTFSNVTFQYDDRGAALEKFSLDVAPGQTIALVGESGGGKTTVFNLLMRFFDPESGAITIDGQDIKTVRLGSLRDHIGLVTQEPFLFDDTIRQNIAYGNSTADATDIEAAAQSAQAHEFISTLPQGYDTMMGEGGMRLSGGQRQRIAIARAMLKNAPILLLDEATSALDSESETRVQDALKKLAEGRTTLIISHRLSSVSDADQIYVIRGGEIIETGTHHHLLSAGGAYTQLYAQQSTNDDSPQKS